MDDELFSDELASLSQLCERWNAHGHTLAYIVRSRRIPHERVVGIARLFNKAQQRAIFSVLHRHIDADDAVTVPVATETPELDDDELQRREEEIAELKSSLAELREGFAELKAQSAETRAQLAETRTEVALLRRKSVEEN